MSTCSPTVFISSLQFRTSRLDGISGWSMFWQVCCRLLILTSVQFFFGVEERKRGIPMFETRFYFQMALPMRLFGSILEGQLRRFTRKWPRREAVTTLSSLVSAVPILYYHCIHWTIANKKSAWKDIWSRFNHPASHPSPLSCRAGRAFFSLIFIFPFPSFLSCCYSVIHHIIQAYHIINYFIHADMNLWQYPSHTHPLVSLRLFVRD